MPGGKPESAAQTNAHRGAASGNGDPLQYLQSASLASLPSTASDIMGIRPGITCYQRH